MTAALLGKKLVTLGACKEGRVWIEAGNFPDYRSAWRACPAAEFMCWLSTRTMGVAGTRPSVACAKAAGQIYDEPLIGQTLALAEQIIDKKSKDTKQLQVLAYDAAALALSTKRPGSEALLAASYAAYAVSLAVISSEDVDAEQKLKHIMKAAGHASDAVIHAWAAMPGRNQGLANLVRSTVNEDAAYQAWVAMTGG